MSIILEKHNHSGRWVRWAPDSFMVFLNQTFYIIYQIFYIMPNALAFVKLVLFTRFTVSFPMDRRRETHTQIRKKRTHYRKDCFAPIHDRKIVIVSGKWLKWTVTHNYIWLCVWWLVKCNRNILEECNVFFVVNLYLVTMLFSSFV